MWILSQNKHILTNGQILYAVSKNKLYLGETFIGEYNSEEEALEVLNNLVKELDYEEHMFKIPKADFNITEAPLFEVGERVLYQNGSRFEIGVIKEVCEREYEGKKQFSYRVWYHTGETTAMTNEWSLHKIWNNYAFEIRRKDPNEV